MFRRMIDNDKAFGVKEMKQVYVIVRSKGSWDDHVKYPIAVCDTEEKAKQMVEDKNAQLERIKDAIRPEFNRLDGIENPYENMSIEEDRLWWRYSEILDVNGHHYVKVPLKN